MNKEEMKAKIDELNEKMKDLGEKTKDSIDTAKIKSMYAKDNIADLHRTDQKKHTAYSAANGQEYPRIKIQPIRCVDV